MYLQLGARPRETQLDWTFPNGMTVKFAHLEHERTVYNYQGAAIPLICLAKGTPILMGDKSYKNIEDVAVDDMVMTLQGPRRVKKTYPKMVKDCVLAETFNSRGDFVGRQVHPKGHPILTSCGWKCWDELTKHLKNPKKFFLERLPLFIQEENSRRIKYQHPYTHEERRSHYTVDLGSCILTPYGESEVYDLTIEGENHYITQSKCVNSNCFDEVTHFTETQFFYMLSRNRSTSGVSGYIRATCNPDPDSFIRKLIDWWIDEEGYPIPERSGVLRWFIRRDDSIIWADTREELIETYGSDEIPKSLTFIPSKLSDNQILMKKDPSYLSNLMALSRVDRMRLLGGNWNVRESAGSLFQTEWFTVIDAIPTGWHSVVRAWDRAASKVSESNKDPDWTRGIKIYRYPDNTFVIADMKSLRDTPGQVEKLIKAVANLDGQGVRIISQQDPGSAGVLESDNFIRMLIGYDVRTVVISKDKITRAKPVSAQCEAGNIKVLRAPWNAEFFKELENFPTGKHDDQVDVLSLGFNELSVGHSIMDVFHRLGPN